MSKLIKDFGLNEPIIKRAKEGMPIWGTCAGMILMAKEIVNENYVHLGLMDISVRRNKDEPLKNLDMWRVCRCR